MTVGEGAWIGHPPKVLVVERMYLSQVPAEERGAFMSVYGARTDLSHSGEPIFPKAWYTKWKQQN